MIIEPTTSSIICSVDVGSTPVFIQTCGEYDLDWNILVSCRDSKVYTIHHDVYLNKALPKPNMIELECPPIAFSLFDKQTMYVATMDSQVHCFKSQGLVGWLVGWLVFLTFFFEYAPLFLYLFIFLSLCMCVW
jgi:Bardet-Biedl syndrome 1 protein